MEGIEDTAQYSSWNNVIPTSLKQEPEYDCETSFEQNMNNVLDYQILKAEPKDGSDGSDVVMCDGDEALEVKLESEDPETAGCGVDGSLRGKFKEEETSQDPNGNLK